MIEYKQQKSESSNEVFLPKQNDRSKYYMDELLGDQRDIFDHVF